MTHLLLKRSAAAARGRQGASIDKAGKAGNSPPSCDGHHSGASQSELIHTPKLAFSSRARTLPRFPAGLFFCAALDSGVPHKLGLCSLFVLEGAVRNHFKHSVELVDGEGDIVDVLAAGRGLPTGPGHVPGRETTMAEGAHSTEPADQDRGGQQ